MNICSTQGLSDGRLLLLPRNALQLVFDKYPRLRKQILEELAREVSRGYTVLSRNPITYEFPPRNSGRERLK